MYDLILHGGELVDPEGPFSGRFDIGIEAGRIVAVEPALDADRAREILDVRGHLVVPGLVDLHCHIFPGATSMGLDADELAQHGGVTTLADAGSCGSETFELFRRWVVDRAPARVFCFVNLSRIGLTGSSAAGELATASYADPDGVAKILAAHPAVVAGIKIRISREVTGGPSLGFLRSARRVAESAGRPVLVHIGNSVEPIAEILHELAPGDIVTHYQTPKPNGLVDKDLQLLPEAREARDNGVLFDCGHGVTHFDFPVAKALLDQGFPPDVISTDISRTSYADLKPGITTVMNKWLALGMPLGEVVKASTSAPADVLQDDPDFGRLAVGKVADLAVLSPRLGNVTLHDAAGRELTGRLRLEPSITIKDGMVVWSPQSSG